LREISQLKRGLKYRADIDGLRGVAILMVLVFHAFYIPGGFIGVDVFFVISGFLISSIIFSELKKGTFSYIGFYIRRINRIFPALIVVLLTCLGIGWFLLLPNEYLSLGKHVAAGAGFLSNIALYREIGYFDVLKDHKPLLHLWSLGIEEQFYLIIPLLLALLWKKSRNLGIYLLAICVASFGLNIWLTHQSSTAAFYLPFTRFWELTLGIVLAWSSSDSKIQNSAGWLGIGALVASMILINEQRTFPGWWALLPTVGTLLLIWAGQQSWINRNILSHPILVSIGLISYPLYLWHWPLLSFARITGIESPLVNAELVALSFILAWLTYRYIEMPIRFGQKKAKSAVWLFVIMAVVGTLGLVVYKRSGFESRYASDPIIRDDIEQLKGLKTEQDDNCKTLTQNLVDRSDFDFCRFYNIGRTETVALIGDSYAPALYTGLEEEASKSGKNILLLGISGCPIFHGVVSGITLPERIVCGEKSEAILKLLQIKNDVKEVLITTRSFRYLPHTNTATVVPDSILDPEQSFYQGLRDTVALLNRAGKKVFYVLDPPGTKINPRNCLHPLSQNKCSITFNDILSDQTQIRDIVHSIPNLIIIDPLLYLCSQNICPAFDGNKLLYSDTHHLSPNGSRFLAPFIEPYLQKALKP